MGFIICVLKNLLNRFFGINILLFKVRGIPIGRYCVSAAYRSDLAYRYHSIYIFRLFFYLYKSYCYINQINSIVNSTVALYAYDPSYMYGILCEIAIKNNIVVYHNRYPYRLCRIVTKNLDCADDLFCLPYDYSARDIQEGKNIMNEIINDSSKISYMQGIDFHDISPEVIASIDRFDPEVIIYVHSFSDAQQAYLDTTFLNVFDWLAYSLRFLRDKRVILKAHPSFWTKSSNAIHRFDQNVWRHFLSKFNINVNSNIKIIDFPIVNSDLLRSINSKCILISHHGNVT